MADTVLCCDQVENPNFLYCTDKRQRIMMLDENKCQQKKITEKLGERGASIDVGITPDAFEWRRRIVQDSVSTLITRLNMNSWDFASSIVPVVENGTAVVLEKKEKSVWV